METAFRYLINAANGTQLQHVLRAMVDTCYTMGNVFFLLFSSNRQMLDVNSGTVSKKFVSNAQQDTL